MGIILADAAASYYSCNLGWNFLSVSDSDQPLLFLSFYPLSTQCRMRKSYADV